MTVETEFYPSLQTMYHQSKQMPLSCDTVGTCHFPVANQAANFLSIWVASLCESQDLLSQLGWWNWWQWNKFGYPAYSVVPKILKTNSLLFLLSRVCLCCLYPRILANVHENKKTRMSFLVISPFRSGMTSMSLEGFGYCWLVASPAYLTKGN